MKEDMEMENYGDFHLTDLPFKHLIQIPGPNPILMPGGKGAWDEDVIECCNVFKDGQTYYLYYHGRPKDRERWPRGMYRIGVATSAHPLGPWKKYGAQPILDIGPEGTWDDYYVACAAILKEEEDKYFMWYTGRSARDQERSNREGHPGHRDVGLAIATSPLGPWQKYHANPVIQDFGYVGGVVKARGKYFLYSEYPVGFLSDDRGPIALATAESPEGPWEKYAHNPILPVGDWGCWDDTGYSESGVIYRDGLFHMFYSGNKWKALESIGYAYSLDGYTWRKSYLNPVALREMNPDASAFGEAHALFEPPLIYVYHTLRYISRPGTEDLGVQILAMRRPFRFSMPVITMDKLGGGTVSSLGACPHIALDHVTTLAITAQCTYHPDAKAPLRIHVRSSCNGYAYDTDDLATFDNHFVPGNTVQKTFQLPCHVRFIKVLVENLDSTHEVKEVKLSATLGSS